MHVREGDVERLSCVLQFIMAHKGRKKETLETKKRANVTAEVMRYNQTNKQSELINRKDVRSEKEKMY